MVDMDVDADALAAACRNRAVSKKLFQQLQQQQKNFARSYYQQSIIEQQQQQQQEVMLHRTPSGAQKKIRQRQEQKWLKATSSSNMDQQQSNVNHYGYRNFVASNAYKSILPDDTAFLIPALPPRAAPRVSAPLSSSLTPLNSPANPPVNLCSVPSTSAIGGKPTVEVHPMPSSQQAENSDRSQRSSPDLINEKIREKPAVPKKPSKLVIASHSLAGPVQQQFLNASSLNPTSIPQHSTYSPVQSAAPPFSSKNNPQPSTSTRLFSTPSLMCLHNAMMQPGLTNEEIERIEAKRQMLIGSISHKVAVLDNERVVLEEEFAANDALRRLICDELNERRANALVDKIERNFIQNSQLITLEKKLLMQLERYETMCDSKDPEEEDMRNARVVTLRRQLVDHGVLRKAFDRRDAEVDKQIEMTLNEQRLSQWRYYKEVWKKLTAERQEIDERLTLGREQLAALQKARPAMIS
uniref:ASD2 domain-containing protein n=1 Tax=Syphacia muris TaxID=451379 RepID=A0A0N5AFJ1_9BILA